jgi:hypothetical protein
MEGDAGLDEKIRASGMGNNQETSQDPQTTLKIRPGVFCATAKQPDFAFGLTFVAARTQKTYRFLLINRLTIIHVQNDRA